AFAHLVPKPAGLFTAKAGRRVSAGANLPRDQATHLTAFSRSRATNGDLWGDGSLCGQARQQGREVTSSAVLRGSAVQGARRHPVSGAAPGQARDLTGLQHAPIGALAPSVSSHGC